MAISSGRSMPWRGGGAMTLRVRSVPPFGAAAANSASASACPNGDCVASASSTAGRRSSRTVKQSGGGTNCAAPINTIAARRRGAAWRSMSVVAGGFSVASASSTLAPLRCTASASAVPGRTWPTTSMPAPAASRRRRCMRNLVSAAASRTRTGAGRATRSEGGGGNIAVPVRRPGRRCAACAR